MAKSKLIDDIVKNLKHLDSLEQINSLKEKLTELTSSTLYFNKYNEWNLLIAKIYLQSSLEAGKKKSAKNIRMINQAIILDNEIGIKDSLFEANEIDPCFTEKLLESIE